MVNNKTKFINISIAIGLMLSATACNSTIFGLSDKQIAKYYQASDLIEAANTDYGDKYDKVIEAYFNIGLDYEKNIKELEKYFKDGLISQSLLDSCKRYEEYTSNMIGDFRIEYSTNGNPKKNMGNDMSSVFSMVEQLERGWIGAWMYAIPENEMNDVLNAYYNNNLLLDFENGSYTIVEYKTDVYGNKDSENDTSRKLGLSDGSAYDITTDGEEENISEIDEYTEYIEENQKSKYTKYEILSKDMFANFIVYKIVNPKTQSSSNFTAVIDNGKVVEINGGFNK